MSGASCPSHRKSLWPPPASSTAAGCRTAPATIEPGLYFRADDLLIPEEYRGIGVRIEDDVVVNADGTVTRLSEDIPRTIADVEEWIARVQSR